MPIYDAMDVGRGRGYYERPARVHAAINSTVLKTTRAGAIDTHTHTQGHTNTHTNITATALQWCKSWVTGSWTSKPIETTIDTAPASPSTTARTIEDKEPSPIQGCRGPKIYVPRRDGTWRIPVFIPSKLPEGSPVPYHKVIRTRTKEVSYENNMLVHRVDRHQIMVCREYVLHYKRDLQLKREHREKLIEAQRLDQEQKAVLDAKKKREALSTMQNRVAQQGGTRTLPDPFESSDEEDDKEDKKETRRKQPKASTSTTEPSKRAPGPDVKMERVARSTIKKRINQPRVAKAVPLPDPFDLADDNAPEQFKKVTQREQPEASNSSASRPSLLSLTRPRPLAPAHAAVLVQNRLETIAEEPTNIPEGQVVPFQASRAPAAVAEVVVEEVEENKSVGTAEQPTEVVEEGGLNEDVEGEWEDEEDELQDSQETMVNKEATTPEEVAPQGWKVRAQYIAKMARGGKGTKKKEVKVDLDPWNWERITADCWSRNNSKKIAFVEKGHCAYCGHEQCQREKMKRM